MPVPLPGVAPTSAEDITQLDLTRHRWAGLPVEMQLVATDGAGQTGLSEPLDFTLPEKLFLDPIARVAQEVRVTVLREPRDYEELSRNETALQQDALNVTAANRLDTAPPDIQKAALMLDAMTYKGERYIPDQVSTSHSALRRVFCRLRPRRKKPSKLTPALGAGPQVRVWQRRRCPAPTGSSAART